MDVLLVSNKMENGYPLWVIIVLGLLAGIGTFWGKIKSTIEVLISGKQNLEAIRMKNEAEEILKLKDRISIVEAKNIKLIKSNSALSMAVMFMIGEYEKANPENNAVIENVKQIIKDNLIDG